MSVKTVIVESMENYLNANGLTSSAIAHASHSMREYDAYVKGRLDKDTKALSFGTLFHSFFEEGPEVFWNTRKTKPTHINRRTKDGKAEYEEFCKEFEGYEIVDPSDKYRIERMYLSIITHPDPLLEFILASDHHAERSIYWDECGLKMKCRPDREITVDDDVAEGIERLIGINGRNSFDFKVCMDLKTTTSAAPNDWARPFGTIQKFQYDLKAAHYIAGTDCDAFCWLAVESQEPFDVCLYWMSTDSMKRMIAKREQIVEQIVKCKKLNEYLGYPSNIVV